MESRYSYSLKQRYLAYLALLAGWFFFCYWLYAKEIYPQLHDANGVAWPVYIESLQMPVAFKWESDIPYAGKGFETWADKLMTDKAESFFVVKGLYFRDENGRDEVNDNLGLRRAERLVEYLQIPESNVMILAEPAEVNADVRSAFFKSVQIDKIRFIDLINTNSDSMEVCFPVGDSLLLPTVLNEQLNNWLVKNVDKKERLTVLKGTADGTGVSESADMGWERALVIKKELINQGWTEDRITINSDQRSHSVSVRNRCVIIYFQ